MHALATPAHAPHDLHIHFPLQSSSILILVGKITVLTFSFYCNSCFVVASCDGGCRLTVVIGGFVLCLYLLGGCRETRGA